MKKRLFKGCLLPMLIFTFLIFTKNSTSMASWHDATPPKVGTVKILTQSVYAPGTIAVEVSDVVEEDSGIKSVYVKFARKASSDEDKVSYGIRFSSYFGKRLFTGDTGIVTFTMPSDVPSGKYSITSVTISDESNGTIYDYDTKLSNDHYLLKSISSSDGVYEYCNIYGNCYVYGNEFDEDISVNNPNLPTILQNMEDGKVANIYGSTKLPKSAFDAIKGTDKNIMMNADEGVKWIFNGQDVTNESKDVDCKVDISAVPGANYGSNGQLMRIDFAPNGTLPGKAKIKLKSDYLYQLYNLPQDLNLYYLDEESKTITMEDSSVEVVMDGSTGWCEFDITHNSSFLLSHGKLIYNEPIGIDDPKPTPYVKLNATTLPLQVGKSTTALKIKGKVADDKVKSWKSSKPKVVSVTKKGKLTAKKVGTAYITVTMKSGATAKCKVMVQKGAVKTKKLIVNKKSVILKKGKAFVIETAKSPLTATDKVTYSTSNKKVATVNGKGKVKAVKKGKATITVKSGKKVVKVKIRVK